MTQRPPVKFKWRGIHHGYLGGWLIAFGFFFLYMNQGNNLDPVNWLYMAVVATGTYLVLDDCIEHWVTADTPLRILWEWMVKR